MKGPFPLEEQVVVREVTQKSPGVFILAENWEHASLIGRSDDDVAAKLKWWANINGKYNFFWYDYSDSVKTAFETECHLFHTYDNLENETHPQRPEEVPWQCPECKIFN